MAGLDIALLTGRSSLLMQQTRLATTGNNIANADTDGYHRQTVARSPAAAVQSTAGQIGTGVQVENVVRTYDAALERNLRQTISQDGYYQAYTQQVRNVETTLAPHGTSRLADAMTDFATSWSQVDAAPTSSAARETCLQNGAALASEINRTRSNLVGCRNTVADSAGNGLLQDTVETVNQLATQIASLNRQIVEVESRRYRPQQAHDLRDRREKLVSDLARLADIAVTEKADGAWDLDIGGQALVSGDAAARLAVQRHAERPAVVWESTGEVVTQDGGEIEALLDAERYIQSTIDELDLFAASLADTVNAQHAAGFDRLGNVGSQLFDAADPATVTFLLADADHIAAAAVPGQTADTANAREIYAALGTPLAALGNDSLLARPDRLVDSVAMDTASASALAEGTAAGISMFENAIGEVSGVNIDQEMLTMLETQRAYQASARFVGVVDEMLAEVVQMV